MALSKEDLELVAALASQAAVAAVQSMQGGAVAPSKPAVDLPEDKEDEAEARRVVEENEAAKKRADALVVELLPMLMQPRHLQVFQWVARGRGIDDGEMLRQLVRAEVARVTPLWRESQGMGGGSTKNPETLSELKRLREENPND